MEKKTVDRVDFAAQEAEAERVLREQEAIAEIAGLPPLEEEDEKEA